MTVNYCDVCGIRTTPGGDAPGGFDNLFGSRKITIEDSNADEPFPCEMNLCNDCRRRLMIAVRFRSERQRMVQEVSFKNRIRFLFKMQFKYEADND